MLSYQHDGALEDASTLPGVLSTQQQPPAYRGNSVEGGKHGISVFEGQCNNAEQA